MKEFLSFSTEIIYALAGLVSVSTAFRALKNSKTPYGTALFWLLLGIIFIFGKALPPILVGVFILIFAALTLTKQVNIGEFKEIPREERVANSKKFGNLIFLPSLALAFTAMALVMVKFPFNGEVFKLPSALALGLSSLLALLVGAIVTKPNVKQLNTDTNKLLMQVGAASLLPQLLGTLGAVFNKAGVGEVISSGLSTFIEAGNPLIGVIIYCLGMVIFTMIMGNAFAAFAVITAGVGVPFLLVHGANPVIVGALGMTCGYCGTLMTPMAANFNLVPSALLDMRDKYGVIKSQTPVALALIVIHIILMYTLAF